MAVAFIGFRYHRAYPLSKRLCVSFIVRWIIIKM